MVLNTDMGIKRQLSRSVSVVSGTRPFRTFGRCVGVVAVMAIGIICGHFMYHYLVTLDHVTFDPDHEQVVRRDTNKNVGKSSVLKPEVASSKQKMPHAKNIHEPKDRDGVEIKKDMSVQFRDYIPRKVFVNCGGTFPLTLELFHKTYPDSHKYDIFTFLPDESYSLFYQSYLKHTLYTPKIVYTQKTKIEATNNGFASMVEQRDMIDTVDLVTWLLTNLHQDDYVILNLDSEFEKDIVKDIGSRNAVEWIDKFYTTSEDNSTITAYRNELGIFNKQVYFWNSSAQTYSDFDTVNSPGIPEGLGAVMSSCVDPADSEKFGLFLFSEYFNSAVNLTINTLAIYAGERKVGLSVFLPVDFYSSASSKTLRELSETVTLGLFLGNANQPHEGTDKIGEDSELNSYRNKYVEAAGKVQRHTNSIVQYVMVSSTTAASTCRRLSQSRHVTVFNETKSITHHAQTILRNGVLTMDMIGRFRGQILAIDLMKDNADILTIYMTKRFEPWLVPASKCQSLTS